MEARDLQVDESRVTGESLAVAKDLSTEVVGGTLVTHGHGTLAVTRRRVSAAASAGSPPSGDRSALVIRRYSAA